jgi:diguanylate cyclase (GGDEF)-like protein
MSTITGLLGAWGISQIGNLGRIDAEIYDRPLMAINYGRAAGTVFEQLDNDQFWSTIPKQLIDGGEDPRQRFFGDLDAAEQRSSSSAAIDDVRRVRALATDWVARRDANAGNGSLAPLSLEVRAAIDRLTEQLADDGLVSRRHATDASAQALRLSVAMTAGALALSLFLTVVLARQIVRPLRAAAAVADRIAAGVFETPIPVGRQDEAGTLLSSMAAMQRRIRDMVADEARRRRSAQGRLVEALESSTEAMLLLDREDRVVVANSRVGEFLAVLSARIREGARFADAFPAEHSAWPERLLTPGEVQLPNGDWLNIGREETVEGGTFLILSEITLRKSYERKLEAAAYEDPLTGISNRTFLLDRLDQEHGADSLPPDAAVLVANIDRFRQINNAHGQSIGDIVLVAMAARLGALAGPGDICARTGGDEFVVWFRHFDAARRDVLIEAAHGAFTLPVPVGDHELALRVSAGLAWSGSQAVSGHDLLRDARAALDKAKTLGGNHLEVFDEALRKESRIRLRIEKELDGAIRDGQIHLEYQPLIDLATGRLSGFEALARWRHPELGSIAPMRFIPVAEETGAIVALGEFVLHEAASQADRWARDRKLDGDLTIAVNLSPRQIADPRNARRVLDYFDRHEEAASRIKLEITEGVLLQDPIAMLDLMREFKARGVELSLDDFGTGYSSLSYLHKFPFDVLKIDRSFVLGVADSAETRRLVRTIIELGQDLGLRIVAEGVETAAQADHLKALGCNYGQGYFFSRPIDPGRATEMLGLAKVWL